MKVVIVGGGNLGYNLALSLIDKDYEVRLIEKDKNICALLANKLDAEIICGDGSEIEVLADAIKGKVDCFIAVTDKDQDNLVASQLAQKRFQIKKVITRANNPRNLEALRKLGIANAVCSTELIIKLIEQELDSAGGRLIASLNKGQAGICELQVIKDAKVIGKALKDIKLPKSSLIVSLLRDDELIIPQGDTTLALGDEVIAICSSESQKKLIKIFSEKW